MANKTFKTRILLKYDSYTNWTTNNPVLKAGELAIAYVADTVSNQLKQIPEGHSANRPILMKVGDGASQYNALPFVSGLAADVYDWAKAATRPSYKYTDIEEYAEYRIAEVSGDYELQVRFGGSGEWVKAPNTTNIPLAKVVSDLSALTTTVTGIRTDLGNKTDAANAEGSAFARIAKLSEDLTALKGEGEGGIEDMINDAIAELDMAQLDVAKSETIKLIKQTDGTVAAEKQAIAITASQVTDFASAVNTEIAKLDATQSQTAGTDGLALSITQVDGKITAISGSIASDVYAPANVLVDLDHDSSQITASKATGTDVTLISGVTQSDGAVSTTRATLKFNKALSDDNLIATMDDVEEVATDLLGEINGSLHLKGVVETEPNGTTPTGYSAGDVVLYTTNGITTEYVFVNGAWYKLGDESIASKLIKELDMGPVDLLPSETVDIVKQEDGLVSVTKQAIAITHDQVTDFASAVDARINPVIIDLDSTVDQPSKEENGYVAAEIVQTDGKLTSVSVDVDTTKYVMKADVDEWPLADPTKTNATGASITVITNAFVDESSSLNTTGATIQFNQALSADNKAATMADIAASVTAANLTIKEDSAVSVAGDTVDVTAYKPSAGANNVLTVQKATVPTAAGVKKTVDEAINELDNNDVAVDEQWVTAAVQTDGQVTVSRSTIKMTQLTPHNIDEDGYIIFDCGDSLTMTGA